MAVLGEWLAEEELVVLVVVWRGVWDIRRIWLQASPTTAVAASAKKRY